MNTNNQTKNEIHNIFDRYKVMVNINDTKDEDMKGILSTLIQNIVPADCPDAYIVKGDYAYGVEHFRISQYRVRGKSDLSLQAQGVVKDRSKMKQDFDEELKPSLNNLNNALFNNLESHSKSFKTYKENVTTITDISESHYRLIIFVEDVTESAYIVKKNDTKVINPLLLSFVVDAFENHKESVWGIIYSWGNEKQKEITGCTLKELLERKSQNKLLDWNEYIPFEEGRRIFKSKQNEELDRNIVHIKLCDRL